MSTKQRWLIFVATGILLGLLALTIYRFNQALFYWLNQQGSYLPATLWALISFCGDGLPVFVVSILLARKFPRLPMTVFIAVVLGVLLTHGLKDLADIDRPLYVLPLESFHYTGIELYGYSFPSGHSITAFLFATLLANLFTQPRWKIALFLCATVIALSRVMVGAHWPLDIFGGALLGVCCGWVGIYAENKWQWSRSLWGLRVLVLLYLLAAANMWNHDGGFPQLLWLARSIGILCFIFASGYLIELVRYPQRHLQRLQAAS